MSRESLLLPMDKQNHMGQKTNDATAAGKFTTYGKSDQDNSTTKTTGQFFISSKMVEKMLDTITTRQKLSEKSYVRALDALNKKVETIVHIKDKDLPDMQKV